MPVEQKITRNESPRLSNLQLLDPFRLGVMLWQKRSLIQQFTKREVEQRYRGSMLGILWSFLNPLFLLTVYTVVFGFIFGAKFEEGGTESRIDFALALFCGLNMFQVTADAITAAPRLILANQNYVTKVIFPLEIFPVVQCLNSMIHLGVATIPLLIGLVIFHGGIALTAPLWLFLLLPLFLLTLGFTWFLSSLGVFLRDINSLVNPLIMVLMYGSAIFYPFSAVPENLRWVVIGNPLAQLVNESRKVLVFGQPLDWGIYAMFSLISIVVCMIGYLFFMKTKHAFADVL